jgi:hypothetical protein
MTTQQQPAAEPEQKQRSWFGRHKILTAIGLIVLLLIGGLVAGGKDENLSTDTAVPAQPSSEPSSAPAPAPNTDADGDGKAETEPADDYPGCKNLTKAELRAIAEGSEKGEGKLTRGVRAPLEDAPGAVWRYVVAVEIPDVSSPATFATGEEAGKVAGPIVYLNRTARKYFAWGTAMRPGSPMDDVRREIYDGPMHQLALNCLEARES